MRKRFIAAIMTMSMITTTAYTAFAEVEKYFVDGNSLVVSGTTSKKAAGEGFSLMLHNLYNKENPAESVLLAEQGVSEENGNWSYTIPLSDKIGDGSYTLRYGDSSGKAQELEVKIDRKTDIVASIDEVGHIFFDPTDVKLKATMYGDDTEQTCDVVARVYTEGTSGEADELVCESGISTVTLKPRQSLTDTLTIDLTQGKKQYGMFVLRLAMVPTGEKVTDGDFKNNIRFSVAKKSEEVNQKIDPV